MDRSYGAIISRGKDKLEYLLVLHTRGHWDFPKGHPDGDESPVETAAREVLEETGYSVTIDGNYSDSITYTLPSGTAKTVTFFMGTDASKGPNPEIDTNEIEEVRWLEYKEAHEIISFKDSKGVLKRAHVFLTERGASNAY